MKKKHLIPALILLTGALYSCKQAGDAVVETMLKREAETFNKGGGKIVGDGVRMDSFFVRPAHTVTYYYTLLNLTAGEQDTVSIKEVARPNMIQTLKNGKEFQQMLKHNLSFSFIYHDKNGAYAFSVLLKPEDLATARK